MRLRKSIFRTPEKIRENPLTPESAALGLAGKALTRAVPNVSGVQKLYFCACEKAFFALRRKYGKTRLRLSRQHWAWQAKL
ncbi:Uncharacterized protein dnm_065520 [Desulfonema magnum]|uniref:Uncharacterized protein n=1 Tax=Desulfonema magnum TaxID=45655 RepID=A0A975GQY1_9BACT|nr:Uncharacterized protein dnm_065520 [Desulfonema magnum]